MQVRWAPRAFEDLERIFDYIRQGQPSAAEHVIRTIYDGCTSLKDFPQRGRIGRMKGRRELVFAPLPYIAVYRIKEQSRVVEIPRIYHGAQKRA